MTDSDESLGAKLSEDETSWRFMLKVAGPMVVATVPADLMDSPPPLPKLNKLIAVKVDSESGVTKHNLAVPQELVTTWYHDEIHGVRFRQVVDALYEEFGQHAVTPGNDDDNAAKKRKTPDQPDAAKRARTADDVAVVGESSILPSVGIIGEAKLTGKGQASLKAKVFVGNALFVQNEGAVATKMNLGSLLIGFGKGKFKLDVEEAKQKKAMLFELSNDGDIVHHNGKTQPLLDVFKERRKTEPGCKVAYHDMVETPDSLGGFTLTRKHAVWFLPDEAVEAIAATNLAAKVPKEVFESSDYMKLIWVTKWQTAGLMPIRPYVVLMKDATLGPNQVLALTN